MPDMSVPANLKQDARGQFILSGQWVARRSDEMLKKSALFSQAGLTQINRQNQAGESAESKEVIIDGAHLEKIDTAGAWILQRHLQKIRDSGKTVRLQDFQAAHQTLIELIQPQISLQLLAERKTSFLEITGKQAAAGWNEFFAVLSFIGETALTLFRTLAFPARWRWRLVFCQIQISGFNALPIIGVTSFLLGIVIAYQGSDQLRHYGANIFVVELVGYSILREFSPLISAIIIAGRSGSAFAAQIGTMLVTEEIDAMRTLGIAPIEFLVLPKVIALMLALPLLTVSVRKFPFGIFRFN